MDNLELAALPSTEAAERKRLLSFVICGGGPTGGESVFRGICEFLQFSADSVF